MPRALPLHHATARELRAAHASYVAHEQRDYAYRVGRHMLAPDSRCDAGFTSPEAIDLLLRMWNGRSTYTSQLTLDSLGELFADTAQERRQFDDRHIATFTPVDQDSIARVFAAFAQLTGGVGAAKALGLLYPRFFPLWATRIAVAYCGRKWSNDRKNPEHYVTFMKYCIEQCTASVTEDEFGPTLLKTLDEWNYCVWTYGWLPDPRM